MGRFLSGNSGGAGGSSATPAITTTLIAGEAVQQGDIITQGADGLAYWANDPAKVSAGAALRPIFSQSGLTGGLTGISNATPLASPLVQVTAPASAKSAVLSNGNVVHAWGSATPPWSSVFMITDPSGGTVVPVTFGQVNASSGCIGLCALTGGGFVIATCSQANSYNDYFTIYDNNGNVTTGPTRFGSGAQVGIAPYDVMVLLGLQNGNFVMVADLSIGGYLVPFMGVFTPSGATVQAPVPLASPASGGPAPFTTNIVQLSGGGFGVAFSSGATSGCTAHFCTFNAAGVQQGATVNGLNPVGGLGQLQAIALANGNWMAFLMANNAGPYVYVFNAAGVQQGTVGGPLDPSNAYATQLGKPVLLSSGNVLLAYTGNNSPSGVSGIVLTPAGVVLTNLFTSLAGGANGNAPILMAYGNDSAVVYGGTGNTLNYFKYSVTAIGPVLNLIATSTITNGIAASNGVRIVPVAFPGQAPNISAFLIAGFQSTQFFTEGRYVFRQAQTPIGVAVASAAQGSAVPVQVTGNTTLRLGFTQAYSVDANAGAPPGQRMAVVGNQAMLSGIQPPQSRRQIN